MKSPHRTLLALGAALIMTACATISPPQPPSLELPKAPSDLRASRNGNRVTLTWTIPAVTTDRQTIRTLGKTLVCRVANGEMHECGTPVGSVPGGKVNPSTAKKETSSYTDTLGPEMESDSPSAFATFAVAVLNSDGRTAGLSNQVRVPLVRTLPPPQDFQAQVTNQGVVLTWKGQMPPATPDIHFAYRACRRLEGEPERNLISEVPLEDVPGSAVTDSTIDWQKTYEYSVEAVTLIAAAGKAQIQVEGEATRELKVFANDVFPPAVPSGLQAVFSGPGQKLAVDLVWAPVSDLDLAGYNIYRHTDGSNAIKINSDLVKAPAYHDDTVEAGKQYVYAVSSVDARGNESARSELTSENVP